MMTEMLNRSLICPTSTEGSPTPIQREMSCCKFSAQLDQGIGPEGFPGRTRPSEPELVVLPSPGFEAGESEAVGAGPPCRFQSQIEAWIIFDATSIADKPDGYGSLAHKEKFRVYLRISHDSKVGVCPGFTLSRHSEGKLPLDSWSFD